MCLCEVNCRLVSESVILWVLCNPFMSASLACDGQTTRVFNLNPVTVSRPNFLLSILPWAQGVCFGPQSLSCLTKCVRQNKFCKSVIVCVFYHVNLMGNFANMHTHNQNNLECCFVPQNIQCSSNVFSFCIFFIRGQMNNSSNFKSGWITFSVNLKLQVPS